MWCRRLISNVNAIRPFPDARNASENEDLFAKYFDSASYQFLNSSSSSTVNFDSKRRVPSCPDPLHNK
ncbi:unnamed protein product [Amaranthus hypochondriacus]